MTNNSIESLTIVKHSIDEPASEQQDCIAREEPVEIRLASEGDEQSFHTLSVTLCSPENLRDMVVGHLFTEGILTTSEEMLSFHKYESEFGQVIEVVLADSCDFRAHLKSRQNFSHPSCGLCGRTEFEEILKTRYQNRDRADRVDADVIYSIPENVRKLQLLFQQTGGVHGSAILSPDGNILALAEDIGRHNALDKVIGKGLLSGQVPESEFLLLLSGRISFELIHKALMAQALAVVAVGAPSSMAIELARSQGLSVYGFVNTDSFNQYC